MFQRTAAVAALAGTLVGCGSESEKAEKSSEEAYRQIDAHTYHIEGSFHEGDSLPENLARFRQEVSGDFILVFDDSRSALHDDAMAIRVDAKTTDGGVNRIIDTRGGSGRE